MEDYPHAILVLRLSRICNIERQNYVTRCHISTEIPKALHKLLMPAEADRTKSRNTAIDI
jgi:hypothetical protein